MSKKYLNIQKLEISKMKIQATFSFAKAFIMILMSY